VKTGSLPVTIATTLDTTAPPSTPPYTAITGNTTLGRLNRLGNPSSCAVSKACQGVTGTGTRRFDAYTFTNTSASSICVDISLVNTCTGTTNAMFASAYTPTFDPANLCTNFLGDAASSQIAGGPSTFSVIVPASATFVVVINEVNNPGAAAAMCNYTLTVGGLACSSSTDSTVPVITAPMTSTVTQTLCQ
jgi:hypothetical protein